MSTTLGPGLYLWMTDPHLDHLEKGQVQKWGTELREQYPDAVALLITGDIAEAPSTALLLSQLADAFVGPIAFVLGNHDYYKGSFAACDDGLKRILSQRSDLLWLRQYPAGIRLSKAVVLVGNSGWYDLRYGDERSDLSLSDFVEIEDLFEAQDESRGQLTQACRCRADVLASELSEQFSRALQHGSGARTHALCLTHVPPFQEAAFYKGQAADGRWAPFFSSAATGGVFLSLPARYPSLSVTVLCGHTHGAGEFSAHDRVRVLTGRADYGHCLLAGTVTVTDEGMETELFF